MCSFELSRFECTITEDIYTQRFTSNTHLLVCMFDLMTETGTFFVVQPTGEKQINVKICPHYHFSWSRKLNTELPDICEVTILCNTPIT